MGIGVGRGVAVGVGLAIAPDGGSIDQTVVLFPVEQFVIVPFWVPGIAHCKGAP